MTHIDNGPAGPAAGNTSSGGDRPMQVRDETGLWLRLEGAAVLIAAVTFYASTGGNWILFAGLFLVPDVFMLGYLRNPRVGAMVYNFGHTYATPLGVAGIGLLLPLPVAVTVAVIWVAHIGFDRMLGYGLKKPDGFKSTHLG